MIKLLIIGQLPAIAGGNYTTGAANVVYELSRQKVEGVEYYAFATNAKNGDISVSGADTKYFGYRFLFGRMLANMVLNPIKTIQEWIVYKRSAGVNPLRYEFYKANFQWVLNHVQPDIIHMNGDGIEPLYFANKRRRPIVFTCHGVFKRYHNPESSESNYADFVTGLTGEARQEIINYLCVDENKIGIIPNGVDTNKFYYSAEFRQKLRDEMGVANNTKVFITVASVQERKGQLRFVQLMNYLKDEDWQYWIVGKGVDEQPIRDYCDANGLSDKVKLIGFKTADELYKYYSAADIYAHASTMEGQALCEIEAFSTGLKILVNDKIKGTIAQSELDEGDYFFMDFSQPKYDQLKTWMLKEVNERKSVKTMDWSSVANKYTDLYKKLLGRM